MKKDVEQKKQQQLLNILETMPDYVTSFVDYCLGTLNRSYNTVIIYSYEIMTFFTFLIENNPKLHTYADITVSVLDQLTPHDLQEYMSYLRMYKSNGKIVQNNAESRARKLSCLRTFFQYLFLYDRLSTNIAKLVELPRIHKKKKKPLENEDTIQLLENVSNAEGPESAKYYLERTKYRDTAILMILAYTGMRVSELCNLDLDDINRKTLSLMVTRKGGSEDEVFINEDVLEAIDRYIEYERFPYDDVNALFLSSRGKSNTRLSVRSIERIVTKYGKTIQEKVTPHTLRRTFGTELYTETGDLYLTAEALGQKNIQTTKDHYATMREERKNLIRNVSYTKE